MSPDTVAFQGRPGAYSELAARQLLAADAATLPCAGFADVLQAVVGGEYAAYGILPFHNTAVGVLPAACRLLADRRIRIEATLVLPVSHALIVTPRAAWPQLRRVLSHPVALRQCRGFFRRNPGLEAVAVNDTAGAVEGMMREGDAGTAAIAGGFAAELHGARILARGIQDCPDNRTGFALFSRVL